MAVGLAPLVALRAVAAWVAPGALPDAARRLWLPATVLMQLWMVGYPLWAARRRGLRLPRPSARFVAFEAALAVPTLIGVWASLLAALTAWTVLVGPFRPPTQLEPLFESGQPWAVVAAVVLAVAVAPVVEEVFFRGMGYNALRRWLHPALAAVIQAAAFGLLHSFGLVHAALAALIGLALAVIYAWRRTLLAPVFVHALQNSAAALATFVLVASAPILGVNGETHADGCLVTAVHPGTGAAAAGLRAGDVITTVDGQLVRNIDDLAAAVRRKHAGDVVRVEFLRDGGVQGVAVTLGTRPGP